MAAEAAAPIAHTKKRQRAAAAATQKPPSAAEPPPSPAAPLRPAQLPPTPAMRKPMPPPALPVVLLAGTGDPGAIDGPLPHATFRGPMGIAFDAETGQLVLSDSDNRRIRKILPPPPRAAAAAADDYDDEPPPGVFERVSTLAGSGQSGLRDGTGREAVLHDPSGIVTDAHGNAYFCDSGSHTVRCVTPAGMVTTIAGSGEPGNADGTGAAAQFKFPTGIAITPDRTLYVADSGNHIIRAVSPQGVVRSLSGCGTPGHKDGASHIAQFYYPTGIAADSDGALFVADRANHRVRKVTLKGHVSTLAGSGAAAAVDGRGSSASFSWPHGIVVDPAPRGPVYVSDTFVFQIRKILRDGTTRTISIGVPPPPPEPVVEAAEPTAAAEAPVKKEEGEEESEAAAATLGAAEAAPSAAAAEAIAAAAAAAPAAPDVEEKTAAPAPASAAAPDAAAAGGNGSGGEKGVVMGVAAAVTAPAAPPAPPAPAVKTDVPNRVNTLVSLALDAEGGFLYACEQNNHCVRRLALSSGK